MQVNCLEDHNNLCISAQARNTHIQNPLISQTAKLFMR